MSSVMSVIVMFPHTHNKKLNTHKKKRIQKKKKESEKGIKKMNSTLLFSRFEKPENLSKLFAKEEE